MSQSIDLGRIRFYYRDAYNANTTYEINDVVSYGGSAYVYKYATNTSGNLPTNTTYWSKLVEGTDFRGAWAATTSYYPNDIVIYANAVYVATGAHTSNGSADGFFTDFNLGRWTLLTYGFKWEGSWTANTLYHPYDIVSYGGNTYLANAQFTSNSTSFANDTNWILFAQGSAGGEVATQSSNSGKLLSTDGTSTTWVSNIAVVNANTTSLLANIDLRVGTNSVSFFSSLTNPIAAFQIDRTDFAQIGFRNLGTNANSSTDIICYADTGDDDTGWIDIGITSSNFSDPGFTITGAHDGYVFVEAPANSAGGGNLVLATGGNGTDNHIIFAAGGLSSDNTQMTIFPDQNVHIEISTNSVSPTTGALTVVGGIGTQGNVNILGDINIQGSITVSGGAFEAQTITSTSPILTTGSGATDDLIDRGYLTEYKRSATSSTFNIGSVQSSNTTLTVRRKAYTSSTKQLTSNVATIDFGVAHDILVGETIVTSNLGAPLDGTFTVTGVTANTVSYTANGTNITLIQDLDGLVAPNISNTLFLNGDRITIAGSNVSAINGNRDFVIAVSGNTLTANFATVISNTAATGTVTVNTKTAYSGLIRNETGDWYVLSNIPPLLSNGIYTPPTNSIDVTSNTLTRPTFYTGTLNIGNSNVVINSNAVISGDPTFSGNPIFSGTPAFTGGIRVQELIEDVVDASITSNVATLTYTDGNIFYIDASAQTANFQANIASAPTTNGRIFTINLIVNQGATGRLPNTCNINGASQTIKWPGGTAPTPTSSSGKLDIFSFTILRRANAYTVFGSSVLNF